MAGSAPTYTLKPDGTWLCTGRRSKYGKTVPGSVLKVEGRWVVKAGAKTFVMYDRVDKPRGIIKLGTKAVDVTGK